MTPTAEAPDHRAPKDGIFRRGFGLKSEIASDLSADYHSDLIDDIRANGNRLLRGDVEFRLAKEFGFCYGVDKAVDFAYETRRRFPDRRVFLTAEIIHNPRVNNRLLGMDIQFLSGQYACGLSIDDLTADDVVILPAFGVAIAELDRLRARGSVLVDTTCGSVVHVWKRVEKYAAEGFTSVIHGKYKHEETIATASYAAAGSGAYLIVFDKEEANLVCDYIRGTAPVESLAARFGPGRISPGFDFEQRLQKIGVANQTTMLSSESMEIGAMIRQAMIDRYGADTVNDHFRSFDTICHATQERQDAVMEMMQSPPDVMIVIGGFNSSNTLHLSEIAANHCPAYHIDDVDGLISKDRIRHKPAAHGSEQVEQENWLPPHRPLSIGVTAGASTPNRVIGEVIERLTELTA